MTGLRFARFGYKSFKYSTYAPAKQLSGLKPGPGVRIPPSPPKRLSHEPTSPRAHEKVIENKKGFEGRGSVRGFQGAGANCLATRRRKRGRGPAPGTVASLETQRPLGARLLGKVGSNPPLSAKKIEPTSPRAHEPTRR